MHTLIMYPFSLVRAQAVEILVVVHQLILLPMVILKLVISLDGICSTEEALLRLIQKIMVVAPLED